MAACCEFFICVENLHKRKGDWDGNSDSWENCHEGVFVAQNSVSETLKKLRVTYQETELKVCNAKGYVLGGGIVNVFAR